MENIKQIKIDINIVEGGRYETIRQFNSTIY